MLASSTLEDLGHKQLAGIVLHADRLLPYLSEAVRSERCARALSHCCSNRANASEPETQAGSCSMEPLIKHLKTYLYVS